MRVLMIVCCALLLGACQVNQVTGERTLQFYGSDWEQEIGNGLYAPMRQSQGGDFQIDPELTQYVQAVGARLAAQAQRKDELQFDFHVLNDSTPNAWALPGGKIAINRGLLNELQSESELAAVLGHEVVHADAAHGARAQSKGILTQIGAIAGMVLINSKVDSSAGQQAAAIIPALGAQLISTKYGRDAERESDEYGMRYMSEAGYDPQGAVALQETFVRLSEGRNSDWLSGLFASHPPSQERVDLNRETAAALPAGGDMGTESYRRATANLRRLKPAYDAYDEAMAAAVKKDYPAARQALNSAMRIEPREAIFHALEGDLHAAEDDRRRALRSFNRAVELDASFFYHRLRRGQMLYETGEKKQARPDLEQSLEMLPTAQAHYLLGKLDQDAGNAQSARYHFEQASQSESDAGRNAQRELVLQDIGSNPEKFVATAPAADGNGRLFCRIGNRTQVPLSSINLEVAFIDDGGSTQRSRRSFNGVLDGGAQDQVSLGWSTRNPNGLEQRVQCKVSGARVAE